MERLTPLRSSEISGTIGRHQAAVTATKGGVMRRVLSACCGVVVMVASWAVAASAAEVSDGCGGDDGAQVNALSPHQGATYEARVPLRFVVDEPGCHPTYRLVIDEREYEPTLDAEGRERPPYEYVPVRGGRPGGPGKFSGCRTVSGAWRGSVELRPGEHHLTIDDCPKGTQVAAAFSEPRVVHFGTGHQSLPDTGLNLRLLFLGASSVAVGLGFLGIARRPVRA